MLVNVKAKQCYFCLNLAPVSLVRKIIQASRLEPKHFIMSKFLFIVLSAFLIIWYLQVCICHPEASKSSNPWRHISLNKDG